MQKLFLFLSVVPLVLSSCGGGGGGGNDDPKETAPSSLIGWGVSAQQMDGTIIQAVEILILSDNSGVVSLAHNMNYNSGLTFNYNLTQGSNVGNLIITHNGGDDEGFTLAMQLVFEEYHTDQEGTPSFGTITSWSYQPEGGAAENGTSGRFAARKQQ